MLLCILIICNFWNCRQSPHNFLFMWGQDQSLLPSLTCRPPQTSCRRTVGRSVGLRGSQPHTPRHRPYNNLTLTLSAAALAPPSDFSPGAAPGLFPEAAVNLVSDRSHDCRVLSERGKDLPGRWSAWVIWGASLGSMGSGLLLLGDWVPDMLCVHCFLFSGSRKFSRWWLVRVGSSMKKE